LNSLHSLRRVWDYVYERRWRVADFLYRQVKALVETLGLFVVVILILYFVGATILSAFSDNIERALSLEILRALIQANAGLVGFLAIVTVYVFSSIQRMPREHPTTISGMQKWRERRSNAVWLSVIIATLFMASLLSAVAAISRLHEFDTAAVFFWPIAFMLLGLAGIFGLIFLGTTNPLEPRLA
jgi:MFS family permease